MAAKFYLLSLFLIAIAFQSLIAQSQGSAGKRILSLNLTYLHDPTDIVFEGPFGSDNNKWAVSIKNESAIFLGFGFEKIKDNNTYQEFSLLGLSFQSDDELYTIADINSPVETPIQGRDKKAFNLFMRFAVGKNFAPNKKIVPGLAVGIEPNIFHTSMTPSTSALYPINVWSVGSNLMLVPKVSVQLNERLSLFGKIPFGLAALSWERFRMSNPNIPTEEQVTSTINFEMGISRLQLNIGLGIDI